MRTTHSAGNLHLTVISLPHNSKVDQMPVFGSWVHPCRIVLGGKSTHSVGNCQAVLSKKTKQKLTIAVHVANTVSTLNSRPGLIVPANPFIKISQQKYLLSGVYAVKAKGHFLVKFVLDIIRFV